jgi:hypothetical protein
VEARRLPHGRNGRGEQSPRRGSADLGLALASPAWSTHALKGRWWAESSGPDQGGARAPSDRRSVGGQAGSSSNLQPSARTRLSSWLRRDGVRGGMAVGSFRSAKQHPEGGSRIFRTVAGSERKARTTMGAAQRAQARASTNRTLRGSCAPPFGCPLRGLLRGCYAEGKRRGRRVWAGKAPSWAERRAGANCDVWSVACCGAARGAGGGGSMERNRERLASTPFTPFWPGGPWTSGKGYQGTVRASFRKTNRARWPESSTLFDDPLTTAASGCWAAVRTRGRGEPSRGAEWCLCLSSRSRSIGPSDLP